jgi:asparagine synthase (glutamine-hydrolysing)
MRRAIQCILEPLPLNKRLSKLRDVLSSRSNQELFLLTQNHWQNSDSIVIGAHKGELLSRKTLDLVKEDCFEHWMMAQDANFYLPDDILVKVDRASMASSLETRVPLLDHRLVELAWKLPIECKIREGVTKWGLREVLYRHVPKKLIERPKQGFAIPIGDWLRGPLRDWAESLLEEKRLIQEGYLNPEPIRQAWRRHISRIEDNSSKLWSILMFQAWLDEQKDE